MDLILGGGVTGLSYAAFCKDKDYLVIEKEPEVGGYCRTIKRGPYIWDYSGHFFHFRDQKVKKFILENLFDKEGLQEILKSTRIYYRERYIDYPFQKNIHQLSKEELIDCLYDLFDSSQEQSQNFKEMLYFKFGKSIAEKFLIPYNEKLYACDLNNLDNDAMGRFFPYANKEEIIKNFKRGNQSSYNDTFIYPKGGAFEYIKSILHHVDANNIRLNTTLLSLSVDKKIAYFSNGEQIKYDRLISTIPFPQLLSVSDIPYDENIYTWNQVLVFNLGFNKKGKNRIDHWLYFPENEYCFYRVGYYDNIVYQDRMSLYVEIGFDKYASVRPQQWLGRTLEDLKKANIIDEELYLCDYEYVIMNPAYVHINANSDKDVRMKKDILEKYSIFSIGRYGSWTYCSIEDNILEAKELAESL